MKEKEFYIVVRIEASISVFAESEEEAKQIVKNIYEEEYNIDLQDSEIIEVNEQIKE